MLEIIETEIMKNWQGDTHNPKVSIWCVTYNHEEFIAQTLEGFLTQETNFPFEIIIDDDASTDNTASIIQAYATKYPSIVKPNLRQKNIGAVHNGLECFYRTSGEYVAFCEGDDYWTDTHKLQYQVNKMSKFPLCDISAHQVDVLSADNPDKLGYSRRYEDETIIQTADFLTQFTVPTSSVMIRREAFQKHHLFLDRNTITDYILQILTSLRGGILFIDKIMSRYRVHSGGITQGMETIDFFHNTMSKLVDSLINLNIYLQYQWEEEFNNYINGILQYYLNHEDFNILENIESFQKYLPHLAVEGKKLFLHNLISFLEKDNYKAVDSLSPEQIDFLRDMAVQIEQTGWSETVHNAISSDFLKEAIEAIDKPDIVFAYQLMNIAHKARPEGPFIKQKREAFRGMLSKDQVL